MTPVEHLAATAIVTAGALLQGTIGFGLGLFAAPLLLLLDPRLVPGPILGASVVLTLLLARREWHGVIAADLGWALSGRVGGTVLALVVLTRLPAEAIERLFGSLVLLAVGITASGLHPRPRRGVLVAVGSLSGFMGTTTSIGGPPMALLYQKEPGPRLRGTLSAYFVVGVVLSLIGLALVHRFGWVEIRLAVGLLPGILIGFLLSRRTAGWIDRGFLRPAVLVVSLAAGLLVLVR